MVAAFFIFGQKFLNGLEQKSFKRVRKVSHGKLGGNYFVAPPTFFSCDKILSFSNAKKQSQFIYRCDF